MKDRDRDRFDRLVQEVLAALPPPIAERLDEISIVVEDRPSPALARALVADGTIEDEAAADDLCGLHTGVALTERSVELAGVLPDQIHLFREGIVTLVLENQDPLPPEEAFAEATWPASLDEAVREEIRITVLHEIGHHFGLDEGDLDDLGYA